MEYEVNDWVMLNAFHRRNDYEAKDEKGMVKFMPRYDFPYNFVCTNPKTSTYTLDLPKWVEHFATLKNRIEYLRIY